MSVQIGKASVYQNGLEISGDITSLVLDVSQEAIDDTTVSASTRTYTPGLITAAISAEGYLNAGDHEEELYAATDSNQVITVYPNDASANVVGYGMKGARSQLIYRGEIGQLIRFTYDVFCTAQPLVRLNSMEGEVTKTSTGDGTDYSLGAVSATQSVYCFLHVLAVSGTDTPTLTVKVQSSADGSTWGDEITMTDATDVGAEAKSLAGANTDTHWRITWTISGTNPSFTFIAGVGIQ